MKTVSMENILSANRPSDIFSMDPCTLKTEADYYLSKLKPEAYRTIENFVLAQKVKSLFKQAEEELRLVQGDSSSNVLEFYSADGERFAFKDVTAYHSKIATMYDTPTYVIYNVPESYKHYFENYIVKTRSYPKVDKKIWKTVCYMLPNVTHYFKKDDGSFVAILKKPTKMYPLSELLDYFGGALKPEYIASIMSRLYYFSSYLSLVDLCHNALTVDNLFFSPGRVLGKNEAFTVDDMRIVGVFGGWFFSTSADQKVEGMPKEILSICPPIVKTTGYSSYQVDVLAIKQIARVLAGDPSGSNLSSVPEPMRKWITSKETNINAYEEFANWRKVEKETFGGYRFIPMDISI